MNFIELQRELKTLIQDASPEILVSIPDYINEAVQQIAEDIKFPELKQVSSVTTSISTYYVNMPTGFSSRLVYAGNSLGEYTVLDGGVEELIRLYPTLADTGDIEYVTLEGSVLYYMPIPTAAATITCIGYHVPSTLSADSDTPSFIPSYLHRNSIVNKAAELAYIVIEAGNAEVEKVNSSIFRKLATDGINQIRAYISRRRPVLSTSNWSA